MLRPLVWLLALIGLGRALQCELQNPPGFTAGCLKAALTVPALRPDSLTLLVDIGQPAQDWDKTMNKSLKLSLEVNGCRVNLQLKKSEERSRYGLFDDNYNVKAMYTRYQHFVFFGGKYHRFGDPITDADDRQARSCAGGSTKGLTEHAVSYTLMGKTNPNLRVLALGYQQNEEEPTPESPADYPLEHWELTLMLGVGLLLGLCSGLGPLLGVMLSGRRRRRQRLVRLIVLENALLDTPRLLMHAENERAAEELLLRNADREKEARQLRRKLGLCPTGGANDRSGKKKGKKGQKNNDKKEDDADREAASHAALSRSELLHADLPEEDADAPAARNMDVDGSAEPLAASSAKAAGRSADNKKTKQVSRDNNSTRRPPPAAVPPPAENAEGYEPMPAQEQAHDQPQKHKPSESSDKNKAAKKTNGYVNMDSSEDA